MSRRNSDSNHSGVKLSLKSQLSGVRMVGPARFEPSTYTGGILTYISMPSVIIVFISLFDYFVSLKSAIASAILSMSIPIYSRVVVVWECPRRRAMVSTETPE